jgi:phosphoglycerate dehydrogenase-like enzyme
MLKVGIVGMGVIGTHIARAIDEGIPGVALAGVTVRSQAKAAGFKALLLESLIRESSWSRRRPRPPSATSLRPCSARAST